MLRGSRPLAVTLAFTLRRCSGWATVLGALIIVTTALIATVEVALHTLGIGGELGNP